MSPLQKGGEREFMKKTFAIVAGWSRYNGNATSGLLIEINNLKFVNTMRLLSIDPCRPQKISMINEP